LENDIADVQIAASISQEQLESMVGTRRGYYQYYCQLNPPKEQTWCHQDREGGHKAESQSQGSLNGSVHHFSYAQFDYCAYVASRYASTLHCFSD
jgi:hypothetical protein